MCSVKLRSCTKVVENLFDVKEWSGKEERYEKKIDVIDNFFFSVQTTGGISMSKQNFDEMILCLCLLTSNFKLGIWLVSH